jgi:hypothetical protein
VTKALDADALIAKYAGLIKVNGPGCAVGTSKHLELIEALCSRGLAATAVQRILKAEGITVSSASIRRHRAGECKCLRS